MKTASVWKCLLSISQNTSCPHSHLFSFTHKAWEPAAVFCCWIPQGCEWRCHFHLLLPSLVVTEYPELEGTQQDHQVQLLAPRRTAQNPVIFPFHCHYRSMLSFFVPKPAGGQGPCLSGALPPVGIYSKSTVVCFSALRHLCELAHLTE